MRQPTVVIRERRILALAVALPMFAAAALGVGIRPAYADTACVVNSLTDTDGTGASCQTTANNGTVTLRSAFHRHVTAGGTNTITFAGSLALPGTITFGSPLTLGGGTLTITGPGARRLALDGGGSVRLFVINSGTLNLSGLTIQHGSSAGQGPAWGGAIYAPGGTLTIDGMTLANNHSTSFGGAMWNSNIGSVAVTNSTFRQNTAGAGGGALSGANVTITNVTATGNTGGWGGAFHADTGTVTVINSTIYANTATDSGIQGGGTFASQAMHLRNTIEAANTFNSTPNNCAGNSPGNTVDDGYNIDSGTTCGFSNHALNSTDPLLNALANNGGPTDTMSEKSNSPALDSAGPGCPGTDQRGTTRNGDGHCDRGAFEAVPPAVSSVSAASAGNNCVPVGASVSITGSGFSQATAVHFGDTPAASFTVNSDSQITAVAPSGSGLVDIVVTSTDGNSAAVTSDQVTLGTCVLPGLPAAGHPSGGGGPIAPWPAALEFGILALGGFLWRRRWAQGAR